MLFFFVFFFQLIIMIVQTIGLTGERCATKRIEFFFLIFGELSDGGTVGIFTAIGQFDGSVVGVFLGLFCFAVAIGFGIAAGGNALMLTKV